MDFLHRWLIRIPWDRSSPRSIVETSSARPQPQMYSMVVEVDKRPFLVSPKCFPVFLDRRRGHPLDSPGADARPAAVLTIECDHVIDSRWLCEKVENMLAKDDVFTLGFLSTVLFQMPSPVTSPSLTEDADKLLQSWSTTFYAMSDSNQLPDGPYFLTNSKLCEALRIHPDPQYAFICGVVPSNEVLGSFLKAPFQGIPVPSRLYFKEPSLEQPLRGKRVAVKDIYDIRGIETTASCRAYASFYGSAQKTADSVAKLIDLGAVIVGKTRTSQFAGGEHSMDWVDFKCSFNPRGDGSLSPSGSSTGSAAGLAAYEWLDYALGTDTLGSMVWPATSQGIFGIRPTHGSIPTDGVLPACSWFDVPGYFARDIYDFERFGRAWYGDQDCHSKARDFPRQILYPPERFLSFPESKLDLIHAFIVDLETASHVRKSRFDVSELWQEASPPNMSNSINECFATTLAHIQLKDHYVNLLPWRENYKVTHGHEPIVDPMILWKWKYGESISEAVYQQAITERDVFLAFVRKHIFTEGTIMVLPGGAPEPKYYSDYHGSPEEKGRDLQGFGFELNMVYSVLGGLPMIAVPVGQRTVESKITGAMMHEPVSVTLVGPPGSDFDMIALVRRTIELSNRPYAVKTGTSCF